MKIGTLAQIIALSDAAIGFGAVQETPSKEITATSAVVLRPMGVGGHQRSRHLGRDAFGRIYDVIDERGRGTPKLQTA